MADIFLSSSEAFTLAGGTSNRVFGTAGTADRVIINAGATGVTVDSNVERVDLAGASSAFTYRQSGTSLEVYNGTVLVATVPLQNDADGTQLVFTNGSVSVRLQANTGAAPTISFGGAVVPTTAAGAVTPTTIVSSIVSGATGGTGGGTVVTPGTFSVAPAASSVTEGSGLVFTVTAGTAATVDTVLTYNIVGDTNNGTLTAAGASDFAALTGLVTLPAGATTVNFTVNAASDNVAENLEGFRVSLLNSNLDVVATSRVVAVADGVSNLTLTATSSADSLSGGVGNDTFIATVAGNNGTGTTLGAGDIFTGGTGTDTLQVSYSGDDGNAASSVTAVTYTGIENIVVDNFAAGTGLHTVDLSLATGVQSIALRSSVATGDMEFTNVAGLVSASMSNGNGDLKIGYTSAVASTATQALALSGVTGGTFEVNGAATVAVTSSGSSANTVTLAGAQIRTVTATGTAGLTLGTVPNTVTAVDASALAGALTATVDANATAITLTGGAGNDVVTLSNAGNVSTNDVINGGAGANTLIIATDLATGSAAQVTNFQTLRTSATGTYNVNRINGVTAVEIGAGAGGTTYEGLTSGASVRVGADVQAANSTTLNVTNATNVSSTTDVLNISLSNLTSNTSLNAGTIVAAGVETINLTSSSGTGTNTIAAFTGSTGLTTLTATGASALTITDTGALGISSLNASTMTGALVVTTNSSNFSGVMSITGGTGNDNIAGRSGRDSIIAGAGNDTITGGGGNDILSGGDGNDSITGGANDDTITGGAGNDTITSGAGSDSVDAGAGDDVVVVSTTANFTGADTILGGEGTDTLRFDEAGAVDLTTSLLLSNVSGFERISLNAGGAQTLTINDAVVTNSAVTITGATAQAHVINATGILNNAAVITFTDSAGGGQTYQVGNGRDSVTLGAGADQVTVGTIGFLTISDTLVGGADSDTLLFTDANGLSHLDTTVTGHVATNVSGFETISINSTNNAAGNYRFTLSEAFVAANANTTTSVFTVSRDASDTGGTTRVDGSAVTSAYNLALTGAGGADTLVGGAGADTLTGGDGIDSLTGGAGNDRFVLSTNAVDVITDFNFGTSSTTVDTLRITGLTFNSDFDTVALVTTSGAGWNIDQDVLVFTGQTFTDLAALDTYLETYATAATGAGADKILIWQDSLGTVHVSQAVGADGAAAGVDNGDEWTITDLGTLSGLNVSTISSLVNVGDFSVA